MNNPVGPTSPFFGVDNLLWLRRNQLDFYTTMKARYGDLVLVRLGPYRMWLVFHPDHIEQLLTDSASSLIRFPRMLSVLKQWNGLSLFIQEGRPWHEQRRAILPAFATKRLPHYASAIVRQTEQLVSTWRSRVKNGYVHVHTDKEMALLTLRIALDALFDEKASERDQELSDAVADLSALASRVPTNPIRIPSWLGLPHNRRKSNAIAVVRSKLNEMISSYETGSDRMKSPSLMDMLVSHYGDDKIGLRDEMVALTVAGHETSGAALSWAAYLLAGNEHYVDTTIDEIRRILPGDRRASDGDIPNLKKVGNAVLETLRLFPPGYTLFTRQATHEIDLDDQKIRRGDLIQIVPYVTQRDSRWFDDPNSFQPDRFCDPNNGSKSSYIAFGNGPRACAGKGFGLMELSLVLVTILKSFKPLPPEYNVVPEAKFSLRPSGGLTQQWKLID